MLTLISQGGHRNPACRVILHNIGNKISINHLKVDFIPGPSIEIVFNHLNLPR